MSKEVLGEPLLTDSPRITKKYGDLRPLLNILYLFKQINNYQPFILPIDIDRIYMV